MSMGKILAYSGLMENKEITWMPAYGPEQRGGTANVTVILSDDPISSPILNTYDMVVALTQKEQAKAEAERDAAIADLKISSGCTSCKYHCSDTIFCRDCTKKQNCKCMSCSLGLPNWEWRGLPEASEGGEI